MALSYHFKWTNETTEIWIFEPKRKPKRLADIEQEPRDCFHIFIINEPGCAQKGGEQR
jgi:hypothetical protein